MLTIEVMKSNEVWDEAKEVFVDKSEPIASLTLEHSLVSLSKWESDFEKPFLGVGEKSSEEVYAYIKCMILTQDFPPEVFSHLSQQNIDTINNYINAPKTATWFASDPGGKKTGEVVTSELIYYWMITFNVPFECQYWHLNRLFTLLRICSIKSQKPKKQTRAEMIAERNRLNMERRARLGSTG